MRVVNKPACAVSHPGYPQIPYDTTKENCSPESNKTTPDKRCPNSNAPFSRKKKRKFKKEEMKRNEERRRKKPSFENP